MSNTLKQLLDLKSKQNRSRKARVILGAELIKFSQEIAFQIERGSEEAVQRAKSIMSTKDKPAPKKRGRKPNTDK